MKKILLLALALGGCNTTAITSARDFLNDPKTAQAAATIRSWRTAFVCDLSNAAILAGKIEAAVNASQAVQTTTGTVYTVSAVVCQSLGGSPTQIE